MTAVDRATALQVLHGRLTDELVVAAMGNPRVRPVQRRRPPAALLHVGCHGLAPSVGLGVAVATPASKVIAMQGDGGVLMNLGALATIGMLAPANLVLIVWDNGVFDLTGKQPTAAGAGTDLAEVTGNGYDPVVAQALRVPVADELPVVTQTMDRRQPADDERR